MMNSRSTGDLNKVYHYSQNITKSHGRILMMLYTDQNRGTIMNQRHTARIENLRMRINKLTLMRRDEIMRVYSNIVLSRNTSPSVRHRRRSRKSRRKRPVTAHQEKQTVFSSRSRSISPARSLSRSKSPELITPLRKQSDSSSASSSAPSPTLPLKIAHIAIEHDRTVIDMVPASFQTQQETDDDDDDDDDEEEEEDDIVYPEGITDFQPYKTVARFRKLLGKSTNFRLNPLLIGDDSTETLILGLKNFAEQHGCDISFTNEDQRFDKSIYRASEGVVDLGSIHLLASDSLLTANFEFEIDLDYDNDITLSKENIEQFVQDFCEAISNVLSCENNNVRVFSIDKLTKKSGRSHVNFGLTTPDLMKTQQLAENLQTYARSGFSTDKILKHVKPKEYECKWKSVLAHLRIKPNDLDPQYNFDYTKPGVPKKDTRGNRTYYLPIGWYRHALNVRHKYKGNQIWLGHINAEGEWPVAFHGTHSGAVTGIVEHGLLPTAVRTDAMIGEAIEQMGEEANRPGLYVATHCDGGSYPRYTTTFTVTTFPGKSETFSLVFQCRVEPNKFTTHKTPVDEGEAWRIVDPKAIRPYGILLKKEVPTEPNEDN